MPLKKLKNVPSKNLGQMAKIFGDYLDTGLLLFDGNFEDFNPTIVSHETHGIGLLFTQLKEEDYGVEKAVDHSVIAFEEGVSFPSGGLIYFNNEQPPEKVALLFLAALLKEVPVGCPKCSNCEENDEEEKKERDKGESMLGEFIPGFHD